MKLYIYNNSQEINKVKIASIIISLDTDKPNKEILKHNIFVYKL